MNRKAKILFVCPSFSSFIQKDMDMLRRHFEVRVAHYRGKKRMLKFLIETLKGVLWADVTFSWFADVHAFVAVMFSKIFIRKSIVVVGGYEVAKVPEINYGGMLSRRKAFIVRFVLKHADRILPFSNYAAKEVLSINRDINLKIIPLTSDTEKFVPNGLKDNIVLTVCIVTKQNIARKGLKTFVESAKYLPEVKFVLIGPYIDDAINYLSKIAPPNVEFTGYIPDEELIKWYQRAKIYCQLSYQEGEGAGGALGEAMACGCIPVVSSKATALEETVGDCGFYVPYGDVSSTVKAIKKALNTSSELGKKARKRMTNLFPMVRRESNLLELINLS